MHDVDRADIEDAKRYTIDKTLTAKRYTIDRTPNAKR